jgi:hypothetical protein
MRVSPLLDSAPTPARDLNTLEPDDVMDETMTCSDLVFVLQHLHFGSKSGLGALKIDREVARYLIATLRDRMRG